MFLKIILAIYITSWIYLLFRSIKIWLHRGFVIGYMLIDYIELIVFLLIRLIVRICFAPIIVLINYYHISKGVIPRYSISIKNGKITVEMIDTVEDNKKE